MIIILRFDWIGNNNTHRFDGEGEEGLEVGGGIAVGAVLPRRVGRKTVQMKISICGTTIHTDTAVGRQ